MENVVEGRPAAIRVKQKHERVICVKCPIICLSNYEPLDRDDIKNRIKIVRTIFDKNY